MLRSGRIGEPIAVRTVFSSAPHELPAWKKFRASGGGALLDLGTHHIDLVRFLLGREVAEVSATATSRRGEHDSVLLDIRLEGGMPVQSLFSLGSVDEDRFEIYGDQGKLTVDRFRSWTVEYTPPSGRVSRWARMSGGLRSPLLKDRLLSTGNEPSYRLALAAFVAAARGESVSVPGFLDGYRCLETILAAEAKLPL
jgi:predicted dehydrogenase